MNATATKNWTNVTNSAFKKICATMTAIVLAMIAWVAHSPPAAAASTRVVSSTAYCDHGTMANGEQTHSGAVAMNGVAFGTKFKVTSGQQKGKVFTVKDRIGHSSQFDIWFGSCGDAVQYGRQTINIQQVG